MKHHRKIQIRWDDLDAFGHVNNAAYLTFAQEARSDFVWFSRQRIGNQPILADMVVARAEVDFVEAIYNGGTDLDVAICVTRIGNSSFDLLYEMTAGDVLHARAKTVQVAVSMETFKSRPINDQERAFLTQYLHESDNQ